MIRKIVGGRLISNMYALYDGSATDCWIVDMGCYQSLLKELSTGFEIKGVFLTHTHFDHIAGLNDLIKDYPECVIYTSAYGARSLFSSKKNLSYYNEAPFVLLEGKVRILKNNDKVELWPGEVIHVLETPGHCESCLTFYTQKSIFTGDSYIPGIPVVSKLPKGNKEQAATSVEKILSLAKDRIIYSGHDL